MQPYVFVPPMVCSIWAYWAAHLAEAYTGRTTVFPVAQMSQTDDQCVRRSRWLWPIIRLVLLAVFINPVLGPVLETEGWTLPFAHGGTRSRVNSAGLVHLGHAVMDGFFNIAGYTVRCMCHLDAAINALTIMHYVSDNGKAIVFLLKEVRNPNAAPLPFIVPSGGILVFSGHWWQHQAIIPNDAAVGMLRLQLTQDGEALLYCGGPEACGYAPFCRVMMGGTAAGLDHA